MCNANTFTVSLFNETVIHKAPNEKFLFRIENCGGTLSSDLRTENSMKRIHSKRGTSFSFRYLAQDFFFESFVNLYNS